MSKGLEALKRNHNFIERYFVKQVEETGVYHKDMKDAMFNDLSIIEKELKALEIIRKKFVSVGVLMSTKNVQEYNDFIYNAIMKFKDIGSIYLTQEEYDLLKEVLL